MSSLETILFILKAFLFSFLNPYFWLVFLLVAFLIGLQYRRINATKQKLYGGEDEPIWQVTLTATFFGLVGGILGSILMIIAGISLNYIGIKFLWLVAIALLLISPRFLCFSYAGTIISLSFLLFGWPRVDIPQLMALVAILHMVESFLILTTGHLNAMPVYVKNSQGYTVGAFSMQKFWPIPIAALMIIGGSISATNGSVVTMPDWWPIIKPLNYEETKDLIYTIIPVMAGLGYGDIAITDLPLRKSRQSAATLFLYSIILFLFSIFASRFPSLVILPALFGALGHEVTIWIGRKKQLEGSPLFISKESGVMVLDVLKGSPAERAGIKSGDIILKVNDEFIMNRRHLQEIIDKFVISLEIEYIRGSDSKIYRKRLFPRGGETLGVIPVPELNDQPHVIMTSRGILVKWIKKLAGR